MRRFLFAYSPFGGSFLESPPGTHSVPVSAHSPAGYSLVEETFAVGGHSVSALAPVG